MQVGSSLPVLKERLTVIPDENKCPQAYFDTIAKNREHFCID
jgi:hypothetical protein